METNRWTRRTWSASARVRRWPSSTPTTSRCWATSTSTTFFCRASTASTPATTTTTITWAELRPATEPRPLRPPSATPSPTRAPASPRSVGFGFGFVLIGRPSRPQVSRFLCTNLGKFGWNCAVSSDPFHVRHHGRHQSVECSRPAILPSFN